MGSEAFFASVVVFLCFVVCIWHVTRKDGNENVPNLSTYTLTRREYQLLAGLRYDHTIKRDHPSQHQLFPLGELLTRWNPDDTSATAWVGSPAHPNTGKGIPRFDFSSSEQRTEAAHYRNKELPFVMYNMPELDIAAIEYFTMRRLRKMISGDVVVEKSKTNKFIYYREKSSGGSPGTPEYEAPQTKEEMSFDAFLEKVRRTELAGDLPQSGRNFHHHYMMQSYSPQAPEQNTWIKDALPMFAPPKLRVAQDHFFYNSTLYRGIVCRFGSKGIAAAAHFDGQRNFVAMVRGRKRYVLLPPSECPLLSLYPQGHPSARHTSLDWTNMTQVTSDHRLYSVQATEVVVSMGEMLYIPANWFHYIISQDASIQCSSRSGNTSKGDKEIAMCGFRRKKRQAIG